MNYLHRKKNCQVAFVWNGVVVILFCTSNTLDISYINMCAVYIYIYIYIYAMKAVGVRYNALEKCREYINMPQSMSGSNFNKFIDENAIKVIAESNEKRFWRKAVMLLMCQCLLVEYGNNHCWMVLLLPYQ